MTLNLNSSDRSQRLVKRKIGKQRCLRRATPKHFAILSGENKLAIAVKALVLDLGTEVPTTN